MSEHSSARQPPTELETVADFVRWGASEFNRAGLHYGHGTDNACDEASWLVLHALSLEPPIPEALYGARLSVDEKGIVAEWIARRIETRQPAAYLIGEARFAGLRFHVNEHVLVPRSPIGELIESGFSDWLVESPDHIADLCTGSGCIAVATAMVFPGARVWATEIDEPAVAVAHRNVERYRLQERVQLCQGDLYADLPRDGRFDLIIANPPYVDDAAMAALPGEYRQEPALALAGGRTGLDFAARIVEQAADYLAPEGVLIMEVGHNGPALEKRFPQLPMEWPAFERGGFGVCVIHAADLGVLATPDEGDPHAG